MKNKIDSEVNPFKYTSYRAFIGDWLKDKGYSYRTFAAQFANAVSFIALAKMLSKGRNQLREKSDYRMSPEMLARLGKSMRLKDNEIKHLILLRLENDAEKLSGQYGNTFQLILKDLVEDNRQNEAGSPKSGADTKGKKLSETGGLVFDFFELLPPRVRQKILEEVILQGKIYAARQSGKAGVKAVHSLLRELSRLHELGAP